MHQYRSAVFWADKLVNLSKDTIKDTLLLADVLINSGQYRRAIDLLTRNDKLWCSEFVEALNILENLDNFQHNPFKLTSYSFINFSNPDVQHDAMLSSLDSVYLPDGINHVMLNSSVALLRGHVHEALNNLALAVNCYKEAFRLDPFCFEALEKLLKLEVLSDDGPSICYQEHISVQSSSRPVHACKQLGSNLSKISWFATGSYYLCTHKNDLAKRHLRKATQEDRRFGAAWLALGHAYAADSEHDQAIAAYCTAAQIVRHSHMPMLYIGVEYSSSGNQALAERFMQHALQCSPSDPAVLHELGTLALNLKRCNKALKLLKQAYHSISQLSGQVIAPYWEPLLNNLGHAYRELGHFDEALKMHTAALKLVENSPTTLETIGLIYAQMGRYGEAIRALQAALPLHTCRTDSTTAVDLLDICVHQYARQLEVPLSLTPANSVNTTINDVAITARTDDFEVGRDINESPLKESFQLLDCPLSMPPPPGIPSIKDDLDIFQICVPLPQKCTPSGAADPAEDVSMELD
ncbi:hypothetical protein TcWFU_003275 [Taenia crassiceps]|uniref:Cell division cycle protein 16-like protein n=1 Tax=Taenia crassiceps TaxID=6207 RepID=A0ABR4QK74_9CEST